jgi:hypothetical protein
MWENLNLIIRTQDMSKPTIEMMREIASELQGTCGSLDTALEERGFDIDAVPAALLDTIDEEVMLCETCGWWCDPYEINDDGNCEDCREDTNDEDEPACEEQA